MSQSAELQLERAEFTQDKALTQDKAPAATCRLCASNLGQSYYAVNGQPVCRMCCERVRQDTNRGTSLTRGLRASGAGAVAALAGAILYYAILAITGYEFGLIAIVVGLMVGKAVNWGGGGRGGWRYQTVAVVLTYLAIVSAYIPPLFEAIRKSPTVAAEVTAAPQSDTAADQRPCTADCRAGIEHDECACGAAAHDRATRLRSGAPRRARLRRPVPGRYPERHGARDHRHRSVRGVGVQQAARVEDTGPHAIAVTPAPARG